jgi:hypothetical protein
MTKGEESMMKSWPKSLIAMAMSAALLGTALLSGCSKEPTPETTEAPAANATPPASTPEPTPAPAASTGKAEPGGYVPNEEEKVAPAPEGTAPHTAAPSDSSNADSSASGSGNADNAAGAAKSE